MSTLKNKEKYHFCLDIGTSGVMGILGEYSDGNLIIHNCITEFHRDRVMLDGQIHDIDGVANIARIVKQKLENEIGFELSEVAIAAAGRTLKTIITNCHIEMDTETIIDQHFVKKLEIDALQKSRKLLIDQSQENNNYFCVGYTTKHFLLDNSLIMNPIGYKGNKLEIEIIATFLPQIVVDGLNSVMDKIGLDVAFMTLEPIAAIEAIVPNNVRLLNIALVDIGAGTSDIAIIKDGTITAYEMSPVAGDEITEALVKEFLLDFNTAEKLKCNLCKQEEQIFYDIVGIEHKMKSEDILNTIEYSIQTVANEITENIIKQNGQSPSAIFLIGGGSQIPRLSSIIASKLDMPKERVVIKSVESIQNLTTNDKISNGPEGVTPIGILLSSVKNKRNDFIEVKINDKKVKMFRSKKLKLSDALILAGFDPNDLIPRKGKSIKLIVNGTEKIIFGKFGKESNVYINNEQATLDTFINDFDSIVIDPALQGEDAKIILNELLDINDLIYLNKRPIRRVANVKLNNDDIKNWNIELKDNDKIDYKYLYTIEDITKVAKVTIPEKFYINEKLGNINSPLISGANIEFEASFEDFEEYDYNNEVEVEKDNKYSFNVDFVEEYEDEFEVEDKIYDEETKLNEVTMKHKENVLEKVEEKQSKILNVICNGEHIQITHNLNNLIFVDIFEYINFDRSIVKGKLHLLLNNRPANYTDILKDGDNIIVEWI